MANRLLTPTRGRVRTHFIAATPRCRSGHCQRTLLASRSFGKLRSWEAGRISAALVLWMLFDSFKTDLTYSEEVLTSSREGELEAVTEEHRI